MAPGWNQTRAAFSGGGRASGLTTRSQNSSFRLNRQAVNKIEESWLTVDSKGMTGRSVRCGRGLCQGRDAHKTGEYI